MLFAVKRHLPNQSEASALIVKLKKARTIDRIQTSTGFDSAFILTVNSAVAEVRELGNLLAAKIIIQTVIGRCEVCNSLNLRGTNALIRMCLN